MDALDEPSSALAFAYILAVLGLVAGHESLNIRWPLAHIVLFLAGLAGTVLATMFQLEATRHGLITCYAISCLTALGIGGTFFWKVWHLRPDLAQIPLNQHRFVRSAENRWALFGFVYWLVVFGLGSAARWSSLPYATEIVTAFGILGYILIPCLGIPRTIAKWEKK